MLHLDLEVVEEGNEQEGAEMPAAGQEQEENAIAD